MHLRSIPSKENRFSTCVCFCKCDCVGECYVLFRNYTYVIYFKDKKLYQSTKTFENNAKDSNCKPNKKWVVSVVHFSVEN